MFKPHERPSAILAGCGLPQSASVLHSCCSMPNIHRVKMKGWLWESKLAGGSGTAGGGKERTLPQPSPSPPTTQPTEQQTPAPTPDPDIPPHPSPHPHPAHPQPNQPNNKPPQPQRTAAPPSRPTQAQPHTNTMFKPHERPSAILAGCGLPSLSAHEIGRAS